MTFENVAVGGDAGSGLNGYGYGIGGQGGSGSLTVTKGTATFTGTVDIGGSGGNGEAIAGNAGSGSLAVSGGTATLMGNVTLGGLGGLATTKGQVGKGTVSITAGKVVLGGNNTVTLRGSDGTFSLTGGTLQSGITSGKGVTIAAPTFTLGNAATLAFDMQDAVKNGDIGATTNLTLTGTFNSAIGSQAIDILTTGGMPAAGTYTLVNAAGATIVNTGTLTLNGAANAAQDRSFSKFSLLANDVSDTLSLKITATAPNTTLYYTGSGSVSWENYVDGTSPHNWTDTPGGTALITQFQNGDRVFFDTDHTVGSLAVTINSGPVYVADMTVSGSGNYSINGTVLTGGTTTLGDAPGNLTKSGSGTLTLTSSTPSEFTKVNLKDGGLVLNTGSLLGSTPIAMGGVAGANPVLTFNAASAYSFSGVISGTGTLVKSGAGTVYLTGANTYTGATTVNAGTLMGAISSGTDLTVASGAVYQTGDRGTNVTDADRTVANLNGAGTVDMQGKNLTVAKGDFSLGTFTDTNLIVNGAATDMFTVGTATLDSLTVSAGTLKIADTKTLTVSGATTIGSGTTLNVASTPALVTDSLTISSGATLDICGCSVSGIIATSNSDVVGTFDTLLVGGVAVTGTVTIDQFVNGMTVNYFDSADPSGARIEASVGGLVWYNAKGNIPEEAHGTFNVLTTFTVSQDLADRTAGDFVPVDGWDGTTLTKEDVGTLTLTGTNTYSGGTLVNAGTLVAQNASALGTGTANVLDGAALALDFNGIFGNALIGAGSLVVTNSDLGAGDVVTIANANTGFTGKTTIDANAALTMQNMAAVGNSTAIVNNGTLTLDSAAPSNVFGNLLSGTGGLVVKGTYAFNTDNPNFTGATSLVGSGSTAQLGSSQALGTSSVDLAASTSLELAYDGNFSNSLSGAGKVTVNDGRDIIITQANAGFTGDAVVNSGATLTLKDSASLGTNSSSILLDGTTDPGILVFDLAVDGSTDKAISGNGSLVKSGTGTLTLNGTNSYVGATTVTAGTLALTGTSTLASSSGLALASGTTFDISGLTASTSLQLLSVTNGGANLIGGGRTLDMSGSTLSFDLTGLASGNAPLLAGDTDSLKVSATTDFMLLNASPSLQSGAILALASGMTGDSAVTSDQQQSGTKLFTLRLDGAGGLFADILKVGTYTDTSNDFFNPPGLNNIDLINGAAYLDWLKGQPGVDPAALIDVDNGFTRFMSLLPASTAANAGMQFYGAGGAYAREGVSVTTDAFTDFWWKRGQLAMNDWMLSTFAPPVATASIASGSGLASVYSDASVARSRIWAGGFGSWAKQSGADNLPGYKYDSKGLALGYEYSLGCLTLGFAGAYSRGDQRIDDLQYKGDADIMNLALYGSYILHNGVYVQGGLDYGHSWNDYTMTMLTGGQKKGKFGTDDYSADLELGYMASLPSDVMLIPSVGMEYDYLRNSGWTEQVSGNPLPLANRFASDHDDSLAIPLGLRVNKTFRFGDCGYVTPELRGAFVYRAVRSRPSIDSGFANLPGSVEMAGVNPGKTYWRVGAGVAGKINERVDFRVDYDFDTRSGFREHNVAASVGVSF